MKGNIEKRTFDTEFKVELRASGTLAKTPMLNGYAAKFNTLSQPMPIMQDGEKIGMFREQLLPKCFAAAIPASDAKALINHDPNLILGRTKSGTLRLSEDSVGLLFENDMPDTSYARDLQISCARGDISQCSFGFSVAAGGDSYSKDSDNPGWYIRSIANVDQLFDVSAVTYPAYVDTDCAVRCLVDLIKTENMDVEQRVQQRLEEERVAAELVETERVEAERLAEEIRTAEEVEENRLKEEQAEEQRNAQLEIEHYRLQLLELDV